jgi:hypothetical protein
MLAQYRFNGWKAAVFLCFVALVAPAQAGTIDSRPAGPDPILAGPAPGPCADQAAGADYAAGIDASGNPVAPAEGTETLPPQDRVLVTVPLRHGRGGEVSVPVDLAALQPQACHAAPRSPH